MTHHLSIIAVALTLSAPAFANKKSDKPTAKTPEVESKPQASDDLWFEAPIAAPEPVATKIPGKKDTKARKPVKEAAAGYGLQLGLGSARNARQAPRIEERAEDMSLKLKQADVRRVLREKHRVISFCGRRGALAGERSSQIVLRFRVDSKGAVDHVRASETAGKALPVTSRCLGHAAKSWQFPADTAGGEIEYPLILNRR